MPNEKILSNKNIGWFVGPETSIPSWVAPTLAQLSALLNVSAGVRIAGTDFGIQASEQTDDRSFADEAGAQSLGYPNFGGNISTFVPTNDDTTSAERIAHNAVKKPRTRLAVAQRFGIAQGLALAAGQEINLFRVITDAENPERRQTGYSITTELVAQDDVLVNYIIPPAAPVAVSLTGTSGGVVGGAGLLGALYQGQAVTAGVTYTSSNAAVAEVLPNGVVLFQSAGTANITATYPGATASAAKAITVTAS